VNVHGSLLPRYRGAAPIQWAIARGETETGVTTMLMDVGLDTGPILLQKEIAISDDDTGGTLEAKLAPLGAELLLRTLSRWERGDLVPIPQDDAQATLAPRIKKEEALVDWSRPATEIHCRVRAFDPWPVAFVRLEGGQLRIWKTRVAPAGSAAADPGRILGIEPEGLTVGCGGPSALIVEEVQPAGKGRMTASAFARGKRLAPGDFLGLAFEATSAFGTVGLSTGYTPRLSPVGKGIIIVTMLVGRIGPLGLASALAEQPAKGKYAYPTEPLLIG